MQATIKQGKRVSTAKAFIRYNLHLLNDIKILNVGKLPLSGLFSSRLLSVFISFQYSVNEIAKKKLFFAMYALQPLTFFKSVLHNCLVRKDVFRKETKEI